MTKISQTERNRLEGNVDSLKAEWDKARLDSEKAYQKYARAHNVLTNYRAHEALAKKKQANDGLAKGLA